MKEAQVATVARKPRETSAERHLRERTAREQALAARATRVAESMASPTGLLLALFLRAQSLGVEANLRKVDAGAPFGQVYHLAVQMPSDEEGYRGLEYTVNLASEDYEFEAMADRLQGVEDAKKEAARKLELARKAYDGMTDEVREALGLRRRP